MIVFENFQIDKDKILTGVVKSTVEGVFITSLSITTHDYYNKENDFSLPVDIPAECQSFNISIDLKTEQMVKVVEEISESKAFDLNKDLIIATAETTETVENAIVDCCHKKPAVGIAYYQYCLFNKALGFVKTLCNECEINKDLIDFILRHNSLDLAIKCGDVDLAIKLWNLLFNRNINTVITKSCGCHGR